MVKAARSRGEPPSETDAGSEADSVPRELSAIRENQTGQNCSNEASCIKVRVGNGIQSIDLAVGHWV
jgi:hypothetical protein